MEHPLYISIDGKLNQCHLSTIYLHDWFTFLNAQFIFSQFIENKFVEENVKEGIDKPEIDN